MSIFWDNVALDVADVCWLWAQSVDTRGYGHFLDGKKIVRAHRRAYELAYGPIPKGEGYHGTVVRHSCDNKMCCNPYHLRIGSHDDNMKDMRDRKRRKGVCVCEENGRAVLTCEQVVAIRADARGKIKLAREYGVSPAQIQRIRAGKAWKL